MRTTAISAFEQFVRTRIEAVEHEFLERSHSSKNFEQKEKILTKIAEVLIANNQAELLKELNESQYELLHAMYYNIYVQALNDAHELPLNRGVKKVI